MLKKLGVYLTFACALCLLGGCDPLTVHKVTSTIFDGVPSMPPADQYCKEFKEVQAAEEKKAGSAVKVATGSAHPPYKEKRCDKCHDKSKETGLIKPKEELCFVCHPKIVRNLYQHGPAAVGSCLECHDPHSSANPALLKVEKEKVCGVCHKERRLAQGMHEKVTASGIVCSDCHNPHAGTSKYFLR